MPDDRREAPSDYAYLEGRVLRLESEQRAIRRIHDHLAEQVEALTIELRKFREDREDLEPWRETTDVRNQRRAELESLRARARDADDAEIELQHVRSRFFRQLALLVPAGATLLYALAELVKGLVHH